MAPRKLTPIGVTAAKPKRNAAGEPVRTEIADAGCTGLYLIVQPSRVKSWALRYRIHGKSAKLTLGEAAVDENPAGLTLGAARKAAADELLKIEKGIDPAQEKKAARAASAEQKALRNADGIEALAAQFIEKHVRQKTRPLTQEQYESVFRRLVLPAWHGRTVHSIKRRDVIDLIEDVAEECGPIMANRTLGILSKFFNWLLARDVVTTVSPCHGVERPGVETARDRVLNDAEIAALWKECGDEGMAGAAVQLMLLTGCRRNEAAGLVWDEIDEKQRQWVLPVARCKSVSKKNPQPHVMPLAPAALQIIQSMPRKGEHVFASARGDDVQISFHRVKDRLDAKLKFEKPWVLHDTRRSVASGLQRLRLRVEVIEAVLGHLSGTKAGIVGVYQRHDFADEKRIALERWSDHIESLVSTGKPAKILRLHGVA